MKTKPIPDSKPVHPRSRILPSAMGIGGFHKQQRRKMVKSEATENGEDLSISRYISTQQGDLKVLPKQRGSLPGTNPPFFSSKSIRLFVQSNHMRKAVPSVITKVRATQILDSRGIPTVEVDLYTNKGMFRASAPSGAPSGLYEALELRDGDKGTYLGNGVTRAVKNVNEKISEAIVGMDPTLQNQIDQAMIDLDKTEKKIEVIYKCIYRFHFTKNEIEVISSPIPPPAHTGFVLSQCFWLICGW
ncbi:hypothetical protein LXL04_007822 [Taraxacum kok-saghyz]